MKYKTMIEIVSEAENTVEAADIAGEYLRGRLDLGISMKCDTRPLKSHIALKIFSIIVLVVSFFSLTSQVRLGTDAMCVERPSFDSVSAIQPQLRTGVANEQFARKWKKKSDSIMSGHLNQ